MNTIMTFLAGSNRLQFRGVEVSLGANNRSIDYTIVKSYKGQSVDALVEVKNWTGAQDPLKVTEKSDRLETQLKSYIDLSQAGSTKYSLLILQWVGFKNLDNNSQTIFNGVINRVRNYSKGKIGFQVNKS
jgi:hypothetical protein